MHSAASADNETASLETKTPRVSEPSSPPDVSRRFAYVGAAGLFVGIAATVALTGRAHGGYGVSHWAPLGVVLVAAAAILFVTGSRCTKAVTAPAVFLLTLGAWSALSEVWGGLPNPAWTALNHWIIAAGALVTGAMLASSEARRRLVLAAVLAGVTVHAIELLGRLTYGPAPTDWVDDWFGWVEGPVGYHNAQAGLLALGLPLALWATGSQRTLARIAGGVSAGILLGALILTQSRGALVAVILAILFQAILVRRLRIVLMGTLLFIGGILLARALEAVDTATIEGTASEELAEFRIYGLWVGLTVLVLALVSAVPAPATGSHRGMFRALLHATRLTRRRALAGVVAITILLASVTAAVAGRPGATWVRDSVSRISDEDTPPATGRATRLTNVSFNGRLRQWRVAADTVAAAPILGAGQGQFARQWTAGRDPDTGLYVLQPHSLQMELLSELGVVGLALFIGFGALTLAALIRSPARASAAAAVGVLTVVLVQASVDWTWSFPAIVVATLLVAGAAIGGMRAPRSNSISRSLRLGRVLPFVAVSAAILIAISFVAPYLANRQLETATSLESTNPGEAVRAAQAARRLNPWDPRPLGLLGQLAEARGDFSSAADWYEAAARVSQRPWFEHFRQARVLEKAGALREVERVCAQAIVENPSEPELRTGPCGV